MHGKEVMNSPNSVRQASEPPLITSNIHTRVNPSPIPNINWDVAGTRRCQINWNVATNPRRIENKTRCQRGGG